MSSNPDGAKIPDDRRFADCQKVRRVFQRFRRPIYRARPQPPNPSTTFLSQKIVQLVFLQPDDLFVEPALLPAAEYNEAVFRRVHDVTGLVQHFAQFYFRDFSLEYRILYPMQITAAKFEHFAYPLFVDVVNSDDIHR